MADWLDDPNTEWVVHMSGGKDSAATALYFLEAGIRCRLVFADTGWEAPETYAYLDTLREKLGPIDVVGAEGGMVEKIRARAGFPTRRQRWCTRELKVEPLRAYYDKLAAQRVGVEPICVTGIRIEESNGKGDSTDRGTWPMVEFDEEWGGWMFRPILRWTIDDVLAIHHRHALPVNPLYRRGHSRVGCYPCIMSNKTDIRLVAEHAPGRIDQIRGLEEEQTAERASRNAADPGRYTYPEATFFQTLIGDRSHYHGAQFIDEIVAWSKTERGGAPASNVRRTARRRVLSLGALRRPGVTVTPTAEELARRQAASVGVGPGGIPSAPPDPRCTWCGSADHTAASCSDRRRKGAT